MLCIIIMYNLQGANYGKKYYCYEIDNINKLLLSYHIMHIMYNLQGAKGEGKAV